MHVPEAFDFNIVFRKDLAETQTTAIEQENLKNTAYYILNALSRYRYDGRALKAFDKSGYLPMNADLLKMNCDSRYHRVIDVLLNEQVMERESKTYGPGRSRRFRLSKDMELSPQIFKELSGTVRGRYLRHQAAKQVEHKQNVHSLSHLTKWLEGARLTARVDELHQFIELSFSETRGLIARSGHPDEMRAELLGRAALRVNHQLDSIRRLLEGDFNPSNSGRDERLHTLLTRMKRELRSFLLYEGHPLVSLDIRSSQPYFLLMLMSEEFNEGTEADLLSWKSVVSGAGFSDHHLLPLPPSPPTHPYPHLNSIIPLGVPHSVGKQSVAKPVFPKIRWSEGFYRDFARRRALVEPSKEVIDKTKKEAMWLFFEPKAMKFNTPVFKAFETHYPLESGIIRAAHGLHPKLLPLMLQRLEARTLLHVVAKSIARKLPNAPLLTIHDSLLTTPEYAARVLSMMSAGLKSYVGVVPGIEEKLMTAEKEFANVGDGQGGARLQTGIESFAEKIFEGALKSYQAAQKRARQRGEVAHSFAHIQLEDPLLLELPEHGGKRLFSPRYYDSNREFPDNPETPL
jgi:hypothetical protein